MAELQVEYRDLFRIEKDPSKAFNVNVSECLETFLRSFENGDESANFTGAAMILQAACSGYGRKIQSSPDEGLGTAQSTPCEAQWPVEDMDVGEDVPMEGVMQNEDPIDVGIKNIPAPGENLGARPPLGGLLRPALQETQLNAGNETPDKNPRNGRPGVSVGGGCTRCSANSCK